MSDIGQPGKGTFVWYELATTKPAAMALFYERVIGWRSASKMGEIGPILIENEQGPLGEIGILPERARQHGAPPHWLAYVQIDDLDAALMQVKQLGGRVLGEPGSRPTLGRYAKIADPSGAVLALCAPDPLPNRRELSTPGEICWHELISEDRMASIDFYARLFGWSKRGEFDLGPMGKYLLFGQQDRDLGGMFDVARTQHPAAWNYYIQVADLDDAVARAVAGGGTLCSGPMTVPSGARIAQLADPLDAGFCLHENPKIARPEKTATATT